MEQGILSRWYAACYCTGRPTGAVYEADNAEPYTVDQYLGMYRSRDEAVAELNRITTKDDDGWLVWV